MAGTDRVIISIVIVFVISAIISLIPSIPWIIVVIIGLFAAWWIGTKMTGATKIKSMDKL